MSDWAIKVEDLGKLYRIGERKPYFRLTEAIETVATAPLRGIRRAMTDRKTRASGGDESTSTATADPANRVDVQFHHEDEKFWALRGVSFEVAQGEVLGIIGRNGAGKSTLLKLIARITEPTEGCIRMRGRVASLLEVGTGFHPELTGRENVFLNGTILGMTHREVKAKFDEIVAFSGVETFLDTPVKRYSSGMRVRLAFAVAAHLEPEVLIIDEVLAVGDAEFQTKCLGKMDDVAKSGRTVLFVSHNMGAVQRLCRRAIMLREGRVTAEGDSGPIVQQYLSSGEHDDGSSFIRQHADPVKAAEITRVNLTDEDDTPLSSYPTGSTVKLRMEFRVNRPLQEPAFGMVLASPHGQHLLRHVTRENNLWPPRAENGGAVEFVCKLPLLVPGRYPLIVALADASRDIDKIEDKLAVTVYDDPVLDLPRPPAGKSLLLAPLTWRWDYT